MKHLLFLIFFTTFLYTSCKREELIGSEDIINHPILWQNTIDTEGKYTVFSGMVIDQDDNIYLSLTGSDPWQTGMTKIISYDKNQNVRWSKTYSFISTEELINLNGVLIFSTHQNQSHSPHNLYFINKNNGSIIESYPIYNKFQSTPKLAVSTTRVYVIGKDIDNCSKSTVIAFSSFGEALWTKSISHTARSIVAHNSKIIIEGGTLISQYEDLEDNCELEWEKEIASIETTYFPIKGIIGPEGNYYTINNDSCIAISPLGQTINSFKVDPNFGMIEGILDNKDIIYLDFRKLYKYDLDGELVWEFDSYENEIMGDLNSGISIAKNGNIYCGQKLGLSAFDSEGTILWQIGVYQDISQLSNTMLNSEGNLITLSLPKGKIYCIKGDGSPPIESQ